MNSTAAIYIVVSLFVGAAIAAVVTYLSLHAKRLQIESQLSGERDYAQRLLNERDVTIREVKCAQIALQTKLDSHAERVTLLEADRGRLSGELQAVEPLQAQVAFKERNLTELRHQIVDLEATKAQLEQRVRSAELSKLEALTEKDRHLRCSLDGQEESFLRRLAEKDNALAALLREKDHGLDEQKRLLNDTERILTEKFSALSVESLKSAGDNFLRLAAERFDKSGETSKAELEKRQHAIDELLKPVAETLDKLTKQHQEIEQRRISAFDSIERGIKTLSSEADQLANALRKPTSRGAWGEMNLQVILENAGMVEGEHFVLQDTTSDNEDGRARTDVLVHLPHGRHLIIDSKTPLEACWEGLNATEDSIRQERFSAHARLVRDHVKALSSKAYWARYAATPDFTIMFVPTEGAYQAALEADVALIADAQKARIYITGPMQLMGMVHAIAYVLREERLARNAEHVQETAAELYRRLAKFIEHVEKLGRNLRLTVDNFNSAVASLDRRVLPVARKMNSLGIGGTLELPSVAALESLPQRAMAEDHLLFPDEAETESADDEAVASAASPIFST